MNVFIFHLRLIRICGWHSSRSHSFPFVSFYFSPSWWKWILYVLHGFNMLIIHDYHLSAFIVCLCSHLFRLKCSLYTSFMPLKWHKLVFELKVWDQSIQPSTIWTQSNKWCTRIYFMRMWLSMFFHLFMLGSLLFDKEFLSVFAFVHICSYGSLWYLSRSESHLFQFVRWAGVQLKQLI